MSIEEMSEAGELRSRLLWVEHDLEHVVVERDKAQNKLDTIYALARDCLKRDIDSMTADEALIRIRMLAKS